MENNKCPRKLMEGVVVEGELTTAVSDNEYQGQREKDDQKKHTLKCYFRGLFNSISTVQSHIGVWGEKKNQ